MGWGNTTAYFAEYFEMQREHGKITIVSLIGNLMTNVSMNPYISAERIAEKLNAPFYNIWAPAIAHSKQRAEVFRSEPWIEETLNLAMSSDIMLVSIGEVSKRASLFKMGYLTNDELERLKKKGAVGDILGRFFDANGDLVSDEVHDRVIGIPIRVLKEEKRTVIGVAGGASKIEAIRAALKQNYVNVLVTDEWSASELLKVR
jgi:DNA-binding transcriptional regulator LsrR (DeoR family)